MIRPLLSLALLAPLAACVAPNQDITFLPSRKGAVELRAVQTRLVPGDSDTVMRDVIATLHDLGYRITKAEPGAGTVSATRQTTLRMAVVVQPRTAEESVVRANATLVSLRQEAQIDSAEFYERNFFNQLGATAHRTLAAVPDGVAAPEPARPAAELNTAKERQAATARSAPAPSAAPSTRTATP